MGARVILACRNKEDGDRAAAEINARARSDRAACMTLDLSR